MEVPGCVHRAKAVMKFVMQPTHQALSGTEAPCDLIVVLVTMRSESFYSHQIFHYLHIQLCNQNIFIKIFFFFFF